MRKLALFTDLPGKATLTSLSVPTDLTRANAVKTLRVIGHIANGSPWWAGDVLIYCEVKWGEEMAQIAEALNWAPSTVQNVIWVCQSVPPSRRRATLSFSHHAEVCTLDPDDQDHWLDRAEEGDNGVPWTSKRLRSEIKGIAEGESKAPGEPCPTCGKAGYKKP